ncbi:hypothetical protein [Pseudomonas hormoni]
MDEPAQALAGETSLEDRRASADLHSPPQQILEFDLKTAKIKKRGAWQCIYQQIKVTPLFIRSEQC